MKPSNFDSDLVNVRIQAPRVAANKLIGLDPGEESLGWDIEQDFDAKKNGWEDRVRKTIPRIEEDEMVLLRRLEKKLSHIEGVVGVQPSDQEPIQPGVEGSDGLGTNGGEVTTEREERGNVD